MVGPVGHTHRDLTGRPFIVIWEVTRACDLACRHCRAEAIPYRDPEELTTLEGGRLIDQIAAFGRPPPLFVMTGGDPFKRPDLFELVRHAASVRLPVAVSPSGTPMLTRRNLTRLHEAGATALSLSLDGSTAEIHDGFRGVEGVYGSTLAAWKAAREIGFKVQVNTTVTPHNLDDLTNILRLVREFGCMTWSVFFLVPTGRGEGLPQLSAQEFEDVLNFLYDVDKIVSVKTTEAYHFRRVSVQRRILEEDGGNVAIAMRLGPTYRRLRARLEELGFDDGAAIRRAPLDVGAGRGFVFVSHTGLVQPSGFLPLAVGNVRQRPLTEIYRESPLFVAFRDPDQLKGRCGACEFRFVCGGSRSRAFGATGDPLEEESWCTYQPGSFGRRERIEELIGAGV